MKPAVCLSLLIFCLLTSRPAAAYRIITPLPFSIANKNYIKIQVLADPGDEPADSVLCDVIYNTGSLLVQKLDASLSVILPLNSFNDGIFYVRARVYHGGKADTLTSPYDKSGIPVLLDRHAALNEQTFQSFYAPRNRVVQTLDRATSYSFAGNNNTVRFVSAWNEDSLFFRFFVSDAQLNEGTRQRWDLFHAKNYLDVLWTSDCIELGFDLQHDHTEWKGKDDYELLADIRGNKSGNVWSAGDSLFAHWGADTRVEVMPTGTINDNTDTDSGYAITVSIPWKSWAFQPRAGTVIGFDVQLYDKDGHTDEPFRSSLSGTNPESNDNTSEWTNLLLVAPQKSSWATWIALILPVTGIILYALIRRRGTLSPTSVDPPSEESRPPVVYSDSIRKVITLIAEQYDDPDLSRKKLADQVFLSEKYLSSLFKKETGENLLAYINHYRVQESIRLLRDTRLPISDIAFQVGYNSLQNFNKNFKAITGQSPTDFRKTTFEE